MRRLISLLAPLLCLLSTVEAAPQGFKATLLGRSGDRPTSLAFAPGVTDQMYVATKRGRIFVFKNGSIFGAPFLDIQAQVNKDGENGLLGLAFHPDFQTNGYLYVAYTTGTGFGDSMISRFTVTPGSVNSADPNSEAIVWGPIAQQTARHKGGDLEFGPDGLLYHAVGDGDAGGAMGLGTAQDLGDPRGKILRFDVDVPFPHVPASNPFVGMAGANPLVWARGFRNPWRLDVDPLTGDVYVADVGQSTFEEVTLLPAGAGGLNGGWPCMEGTNCLTHASCVCTDPGVVAPILALSHALAPNYCSITGGVIYRGAAIPSLTGRFLFGDFCTGQVGAIADPAGAAVYSDLTAGVVDSMGQPIRFITDYARDAAGEVFFVEHYGANVWALEPDGGFQNYCQTNPNSSGSAATIAASGSPSIAAGDLTLTVTDLPINQFGFYLASDLQAFVPNFSGSDGNLCVGSPLYRWIDNVYSSGASGEVSRTTDFTDLPVGMTIGAGETWNFQYWTRDNNPGVTSNTSDGVAVTLVP